MIEEFKELNDGIVKLGHFLEATEMKEKRGALSEDMIAAMHCQYSGMVVYRTSLATRLKLLGLTENVFKYPDIKVGEIFETGKGKIFKCIGHHENGCPICLVVH